MFLTLTLSAVLALSATALPTATVYPEHKGCSPGWIGFGGFCYFINEVALKEDDASKHCESLGGELVAIHSQAENDLVAFITDGRFLYWIGGEHDGQTYEWTDKSAWNFENFLTLETKGHCVIIAPQLSPYLKNWIKIDCNAFFPSICKAPLKDNVV